jgi:hypothetical protein
VFPLGVEMRGNNQNNRAAARPALEFSMEALKRPYEVPYVGQVPGWGLLAIIVAALMLHSPVAALIFAGAIYYGVFVYEGAAAGAGAAPPRAGATYNNFSGSSVQQTQARGSSPAVDAEQVRRARQEKFGSIGQVRQDKM